MSAINYRPWDFLTSLFNGDLTSDGGYWDQLTSGQLDNGNYVDAAGREIANVDPETGEGALAAYSSLVGSGIPISGQSQDLLNNLLSTEAATDARQFETSMRDTELLSSASQLSALGLSPSGLSGATVSHNGVGAASVGRDNPAMDRYAARAAIAKSIIGMAGSMASSGIYGSSTEAVKALAGKIAASAANSALAASRRWK